MISSLFQALNLIMTGRKEKSFFPFSQVLCRQGWNWVSKSAFFHCRRAYLEPARKNHIWHLWFHLAETVWWASASGFLPPLLLLFFFFFLLSPITGEESGATLCLSNFSFPFQSAPPCPPLPLFPFACMSLCTDLFDLCPCSMSFYRLKVLALLPDSMSVSGTFRRQGWRLWASTSLFKSETWEWEWGIWSQVIYVNLM